MLGGSLVVVSVVSVKDRLVESRPEPRGAAGSVRHRLALVTDPRFPGGTATSVAAEIRALAEVVDLSVYGLGTSMFEGRKTNPKIEAALEEQGLELIWEPEVVRGDTVVLHNPSCLKFETHLKSRISCGTAFITTRENFIRPNGSEGFDVRGCLDLIEQSLVCNRRYLAPISPGNRRGVAEWVERTGADWALTSFDWRQICDLPMLPPNPAPRDRRGRHSRPGFEKYPPLETMHLHFPPHAESCRILGGDNFLLEPETVPSHWEVLPFGGANVAEFLGTIDFFVYFTHPHWRESFGWVIAEAIAAGKVVITDPHTAEAFGPAVVASTGHDVDAIVARFTGEPQAYVDFVGAAQRHLERFRSDAFLRTVLWPALTSGAGAHAPL